MALGEIREIQDLSVSMTSLSISDNGSTIHEDDNVYFNISLYLLIMDCKLNRNQ